MLASIFGFAPCDDREKRRRRPRAWQASEDRVRGHRAARGDSAATEGSKAMMDTDTRALVFKNEAGDYFLVPVETFERGRVPAEHKDEVERLVAEANAGDVSGHVWWFGVGMVSGALVQG